MRKENDEVQSDEVRSDACWLAPTFFFAGADFEFGFCHTTEEESELWIFHTTEESVQ